MVHIVDVNPKETDSLIDPRLQEVIKEMKKGMLKGDDDAIVFYTGDTGTGKSTLMFECVKEFADVNEYPKDNTSFNIKQYTSILRKFSHDAHAKIEAGKSPVGNYVCADEFNFQSIDAQKKYNKMLDLVFNVIRLHQIAQFLCWPEPEKINKSFMKDRVKLLFVLNSKDSQYRSYILYNKDAIRRMVLDDVKKLDVTTLSSDKIVEKYASLVGWFKTSKFIDNSEYKIEKSKAILTRVDELDETVEGKVSEDGTPKEKENIKPKRDINYSMTQAIRTMGLDVSPKTKRKLGEELARLVKLGKVPKDTVYNSAGQYTISENTLQTVIKEGNIYTE